MVTMYSYELLHRIYDSSVNSSLKHRDIFIVYLPQDSRIKLRNLYITLFLYLCESYVIIHDILVTSKMEVVEYKPINNYINQAISIKQIATDIPKIERHFCNDKCHCTSRHTVLF